MDWVTFIIIGILAGWVAGLITKGRGHGQCHQGILSKIYNSRVMIFIHTPGICLNGIIKYTQSEERVLKIIFM